MSQSGVNAAEAERERAQWGELVETFKSFHAGEPDDATLTRMWQRIVTETPELRMYALAQELRAGELPDADAARRERIWRRTTSGLAGSKAHPAPRRRVVAAAAWAFALALVALIFFGLGNYVSASLPDSPLYPMKRGWENLQTLLPYSAEARAGLALALAQRRENEAQALVDKGALPELVAQAISEELTDYTLAEPFIGADGLVLRVAMLQHRTNSWSSVYQVAALSSLGNWLASNPGLPIVLPTAVPTLPPTVIPTVSASPSPTLARATSTPAPSVTGAVPTVTLPAVQISPTPSLPQLQATTVSIPTLQIATTVPQPTLVVSTPLPLATTVSPLTTSVPNQIPSVTAPDLTSPTEILKAPTVELPKPTVELTAPTAELPKPTVEAPKPTVELPAPTSIIPHPTDLPPLPTVRLPKPTIGLPKVTPSLP